MLIQIHYFKSLSIENILNVILSQSSKSGYVLANNEICISCWTCLYLAIILSGRCILQSPVIWIFILDGNNLLSFLIDSNSNTTFSNTNS